MTRLRKNQREKTLCERPLHPSLHAIRDTIITTVDGVIRIENIIRQQEIADIGEQIYIDMTDNVAEDGDVLANI